MINLKSNTQIEQRTRVLVITSQSLIKLSYADLQQRHCSKSNVNQFNADGGLKNYSIIIILLEVEINRLKEVNDKNDNNNLTLFLIEEF